jgi:nucleotide-binding universal stress UspA family protein
MLTIKSILCPVDFSDSSVRAYDYAQSLAARYDATLSLLHVTHPEAGEYCCVGANNIYQRTVEDYAEADFKRFAREHAHIEIRPDVCVRFGFARKTILEVAAEKNADLITMGTHGHSAGTAGLLGSVTEYVLRHAACPVLAVPKPLPGFVKSDGEGEDKVSIRKILFCTDLSPFSERALDLARSLAIQYAAELTLLHVIEDLPVTSDMEKEAGRLKSVMEQLIARDVRESGWVKSVVRLGRPHEQIVKYELESEADLVIMGIHARNVVELALFGSTTHRVLQLGSCPVVTVALDKVAERSDRAA